MISHDLEVYTISGSPRGWRVLLGLMFKGIDHGTVHLSLAEREHKSGAYLQIHPRGTVPALATRDMVLTDSLAILSWLDKAYPDRPLLFGETAEEHGRIWSATRDATNYLRKSVADLLTPIFFGHMDLLKLEAAANVFRDEFGIIARGLGGNNYIVGDKPTAVDAVVYPELRLVQRAMETHGQVMDQIGLGHTLFGGTVIESWMNRIEANKGYSQTLPVHWK